MVKKDSDEHYDVQVDVDEHTKLIMKPGCDSVRFQDKSFLPLVVMLLAAIFINEANVAIPSGFFSQLTTSPKEKFKWTTSQLGVVSAMLPLTSALGSPLTSYLCGFKSIGHVKLVLIGLFTLSAAEFTLAHCTQFTQFIVVQLIAGLAFSCINVPAISLFVLNVENITELIAVEKLIIGGAYVLSGFGGSSFFEKFGFFWTYISTSILLLAVAVLSSAFIFLNRSKWTQFDSRESPRASEGSISQIARLLFDKEILACVMACFQTFLAIGANGVIAAIHLTKSLQLSPSIVGLLISMMSLMFSFGAFLVPPVAQRIGYKLCLVFGLFSTALSFMFLGPLPFFGDLVQSKTVTWILTAMYLAFYAFGIAFGDVPFVPIMKIILERKCMDANLQINKHALISPLFNMCYACGMFVGPLIAGILMDKVPHRMEITCEESDRNICLSGTQWTTFILSSFSLLTGLYTAIAIRSDKPVKKQTTAISS